MSSHATGCKKLEVTGRVGVSESNRVCRINEWVLSARHLCGIYTCSFQLCGARGIDVLASACPPEINNVTMMRVRVAIVAVEKE